VAQLPQDLNLLRGVQCVGAAGGVRGRCPGSAARPCACAPAAWLQGVTRRVQGVLCGCVRLCAQLCGLHTRTHGHTHLSQVADVLVRLPMFQDELHGGDLARAAAAALVDLSRFWVCAVVAGGVLCAWSVLCHACAVCCMMCVCVCVCAEVWVM
jgi:hypothetical protein